MIIRRFATALKEQNWMTVIIEFLLVIFGVLIALEVDRYQESINKRAEEIRLLQAVYQELKQDLQDVETLMISLNDIDRFGKDALAIINTKGCIDSCWENLVSLFHSTQWLGVSMNTTAYKELTQLGLPKNQELKVLLRDYHEMNNNRVKVAGELPEYRNLIRSLIPPDIQDEMWKNCFITQGRHQTLLKDCPSATTEKRAEEVVRLIQENEQVKMTLTFWMSTLSISIITLPYQGAQAEDLVVVLEAEINR